MGDAERGPAVSDQEILAVFANADDRRLRTGEVADELPIAYESLSDRLDDLHERDLIVVDEEEGVPETRWRLRADAEDSINIADAEVETNVEAQASRTSGTESTAREAETPETPPPEPQTDPLGPIEGASEGDSTFFEPPGETPEEKANRREALRRAYAFLHDRGEADRSDFQSEVFSEVPAGYDEPDSWWEEVIGPGLRALPDVGAPDEEGPWRYTGDRDGAVRE